MAARNVHEQKTAQNTIIKVRLCPDGGADQLQAQLRELAKGIVSGLSALELSQSKELLGSFVSELFLSVAEQERLAYRRQKQAEGIAEAKARGVRFGPEPKPLPDNFDECYKAWQDGEMTALQAAENCGLSRKGFYRAVEKKKRLADCAM